MIHAIGIEIGQALAAQSCPFKVVDGPEGTTTTTFGRERIVLEHDESGDTFEPARSNHANPKHVITRRQGFVVRIFAQSPGPNAMEFEHRRRAEHVLDLVIVALRDVAVARKNSWAIRSGKFVLPVDLSGSPVIGGAVYELAISFDRAVMVQTWAGAAKPEAAAGGFTNRTSVGEDLETACGT